MTDEILQGIRERIAGRKTPCGYELVLLAEVEVLKGKRDYWVERVTTAEAEAARQRARADIVHEDTAMLEAEVKRLMVENKALKNSLKATGKGWNANLMGRRND